MQEWATYDLRKRYDSYFAPNQKAAWLEIAIAKVKWLSRNRFSHFTFIELCVPQKPTSERLNTVQQTAMKPNARKTTSRPLLMILAFESSPAFREWLDAHHKNSEGLWLRIFRKSSGNVTVTYQEALDHALCHGWIDGQKKPYDEDSWLQKFTPRRARSAWSKINTERAERLIEAGEMQQSGLEAIEAAKSDGRWQRAYKSQRNSSVPEDFLKALAQDKKAKSFFETLNKANVYSIVYRLETAKKPETRERRMRTILEMMSRGEKFHP